MRKAVCLALFLCLFSCAAYATSVAYPVDVRISDDSRTLKKVYEFEYASPDVDISRDKFTLNGFTYSFVDFMREDIRGKCVYWAVEPVEFYSKTADINSILAQLDKTTTVDKDGFSGTIPLNLSSIRVESLGTGTSTKDVSQTRTYPNLASADLSHIPKTLDYNGQTLNLTNVQWRSDNTQTLDHRELTNRYSCIATYGGTATSTYSKGYKVYADYQGELTKEVIEKIRWTAIFSGRKQINYWWFTGLIPFACAPLFLRKRGKQA